MLSALPPSGSPVAGFALWGGLLFAVALYASWADRRRLRRKRIDAVGFMPWPTVFFLTILPACVLLGMAGRLWLSGG